MCRPRTQPCRWLNDNDPQLWTLNGMSLASMGKRAEALQSFQRARGGGRLARD
jgi:hypothetical protein